RGRWSTDRATADRAGCQLWRLATQTTIPTIQHVFSAPAAERTSADSRMRGRAGCRRNFPKAASFTHLWTEDARGRGRRWSDLAIGHFSRPTAARRVGFSDMYTQTATIRCLIAKLTGGTTISRYSPRSIRVEHSGNPCLCPRVAGAVRY